MYNLVHQNVELISSAAEGAFDLKKRNREPKHCSSDNKVVVYGPLTPPTNGLSTVTQETCCAIAESDDRQLTIINIAPVMGHRSGTLSLGRILQTTKSLFYLALVIVRFRRRDEIGTVYIPMGMTLAGLLRDWIAISITKLGGFRSVVHIHTSYLPVLLKEVPWPFVSWISRGLRRVDVAVVLTKESKMALSEVFCNTVIVPNFVDVPKKRQVRYLENPIKILFLSNFIETKGYRLVVNSVSSMKEDGLDITLTLAGANMDPTLAIWWKEQVELRPWLRQIITWRNAVTADERDALFAEHHFFVLPTTYHEGVPLIILEAAASGIPIVTTKQPGLGEIFRRNEINFIDADVDSITSTLNCKLTNYGEALEQAQSALVVVREFTRDKYRSNIREHLLDYSDSRLAGDDKL